ncbi:MAG: hypothetical protein GY870_08915, partial [archaeon]|nr:hypothetical protein [archaeon]
MSENFLFVIIIAITLSIFFFIIEYYNTFDRMKVHRSLIAGISIAYFFFVVLPEVSQSLPEYPFHLEAFEFLFVVIGFAANHVIEKMILQKVEAKSLERDRKLHEMKRNLELVEHNLESTIEGMVLEEKVDTTDLKEIAKVCEDLKKKGKEIKKEIDITENKIAQHIEKDMKELRLISNFIYHLLIGMLLVDILHIGIVDGILFFIIAFLMATISHREETEKIFSDLDIEIKYHETKSGKFLLASSVFVGVVIGIIFEIVMPPDLEFIFLLYSFIA